MNQQTEHSFHAVKEALSALAKAEGLERALPCVTEALGPMIESKETGTLVRVKGGIGKLLGLKNRLLSAPEQDHGQLFAIDGKPQLFVCHPYGLDLNTMEGIVAFCGEHGLTASINGKSSHFLGRTVRLEYRKRENE